MAWPPHIARDRSSCPRWGRNYQAAVITQRTLELGPAWAFHPYRDGGVVVTPILQMAKLRHKEKFVLACSSRWNWDSNVATFLRGLHSLCSLWTCPLLMGPGNDVNVSQAGQGGRGRSE